MVDEPNPDWGHMDFSDDLIEKLWNQIHDLLQEQGRVYSYDLVENGRLDYGEYSKDYIRNRVLPAMCERLEEQEIIETEQELGERNTGRNVWVLDQ